MPKKYQPEPLPPDARIIRLEPGEVRPLYVKASDIDRVVIVLYPKTLANWRSLGIGPSYTIASGSIYYKYSQIESFFGKNTVQTVDRENQ